MPLCPLKKSMPKHLTKHRTNNCFIVEIISIITMYIFAETIIKIANKYQYSLYNSKSIIIDKYLHIHYQGKQQLIVRKQSSLHACYIMLPWLPFIFEGSIIIDEMVCQFTYFGLGPLRTRLTKC